MTRAAGFDVGAGLEALARVHADAAAFYQAQLHAAGPGPAGARALLLTRAVPPAAVTAYGLGYAPAGWTGLTAHLRAMGHPDERLVAAGLSLRSRHGALVDRFRDRLMFPVHHPSGSHLIAFLGRTVPARSPDTAAPLTSLPASRPAPGAGSLPADGAGADSQGAPAGGAPPKYLNSPQTASYRKGEVLYGLGTDAARQALSTAAVPVLVEGPLDAIAVTWSHHTPTPTPSSSQPTIDSPVRYVGVAPCGTALTAAHVALLQACAGPLAERGVVTAFDPDPAGQQAALRAFGLLRATGAWPAATTLPPGLDPADLTARHGPAALVAALQAAGPLADLVVDAHLAPWTDRLRWAEGRVGATRAAARLLATFPADQVGRQVHRVAGQLGLGHHELTAALLETISPSNRPHPLAGPASPSQQAAPTAAPPPATPPGAARVARASYPVGLAPRAGTSPAAPSRSGLAGPVHTAGLSTASRRTVPPTVATTDRSAHR